MNVSLPRSRQASSAGRFTGGVEAPAADWSTGGGADHCGLLTGVLQKQWFDGAYLDLPRCGRQRSRAVSSPRKPLRRGTVKGVVSTRRRRADMVAMCPATGSLVGSKAVEPLRPRTAGIASVYTLNLRRQPRFGHAVVRGEIASRSGSDPHGWPLYKYAEVVEEPSRVVAETSSVRRRSFRRRRGSGPRRARLVGEPVGDLLDGRCIARADRGLQVGGGPASHLAETTAAPRPK